jgi:hypothetical protein
MRPPPAGSAQMDCTSGRQLRTTCSSRRGGIWAQFGGGGGGGGPASAGAAAVVAFGAAAGCLLAGCWLPEAGGADAVVGFGAAVGLADAGFSDAGAVAAGADVGASAGGFSAAFSVAAIELTALLQAGESLLSLRIKHWNASAPPGVTLEQFAMKSDRQDERMALLCASLTWAPAPAPKPKMVTASTAAPPKKRELFANWVMK